MAEFIGARISLVSRSDIRYVGTLHEINSETSTVALENVTSFGTEGRKNNPDEEIPSSDSVYDYIVFRGSDVKDLRIEEAPVAKENKPPQVLNDPAILGSGSRPPPQSQASQRQPPTGPSQQQQQGPPQPPGPFGQHPQYPPFYPPPPAGWGRGGAQGPFPPMPYGAPPPGWYPPPGQGFPQPGPFPPYGYPPGPPGQFPQGPPGQQQPGSKPPPIGPGAKQPTPPVEGEKKGEVKGPQKPAEMAATSVQKAPTPPVASKPSPTEVKDAVKQVSLSQNNGQSASQKPAPTAPKSRLQPVIPLPSPAATKAPLQGSSTNTAANLPAQPNPQASLRDATQAATQAVAAAMAKLPNMGATNGNAVDNLTRKVNEMRTSEPSRNPRQPGGSGTGFPRGGNRGGRGGRIVPPAQKVEVPTTDFDFETSNAKFNKNDLVKEAIAGSPLGEHPPDVSPEVEVPVTGYNKTTSFFDNISSESRDRAEASSGLNRPGGREWRGEEQKKNVETFGQGSVDNGYRGGFRGRGRGRGRGFRGRGYGGNGQPGRGSYRGGQGDAQAAGQ